MLCVATFSLPERRSSTVYRRWQQQLGRHRQPLGQRRPRLGRWLELHARDQPDLASNRSMRTSAMQATSAATTTSPSHPSPTASNLPNSTTYRGRLVRPLLLCAARAAPAAAGTPAPAAAASAGAACPPILLPKPWRCGKINVSKRRFIWRLRDTLRLVTKVYSYLFYMKKPLLSRGP